MSTDNMPPLPEETEFYHEAPSGYTAEQMHAYARAYAEQEVAKHGELSMRIYDDLVRRAETAEQQTAALRLQVKQADERGDDAMRRAHEAEQQTEKLRAEAVDR